MGPDAVALQPVDQMLLVLFANLLFQRDNHVFPLLFIFKNPVEKIRACRESAGPVFFFLRKTSTAKLPYPHIPRVK
jgi:hypothetical protein